MLYPPSTFSLNQLSDELIERYLQIFAGVLIDFINEKLRLRRRSVFSNSGGTFRQRLSAGTAMQTAFDDGRFSVFEKVCEIRANRYNTA